MLRIIVYTCFHSCGGLGDRLNGITAALAVSLATRREFRIHAPATTAALTPADIRWDLPIPPSCHPVHVIDQGKSGYSKFLKLASSDIACIRVRINQYYGDKQSQLLKQLFRPLPRSSAAPPYAAIHIRTGGNGDFKGFDPARYNISDIPRFLAPLIEWTGTVYIASDSSLVKSASLIACRKRNLTCVHSVHRARHIDREKVTVADIQNTWDEFFMLAQAHCLVYSQSGFSELALLWPGNAINASCSLQIKLLPSPI